MISSTITIAGHTEAVDGSSSGYSQAYDEVAGSGGSLLYHYNDYSFNDGTRVTFNQIYGQVYSLLANLPGDLEATIPLTLLTSGEGIGNFYFHDCVYNLGGGCDTENYAVVGIFLDSVQVSRVSDVPVPAALPLLLAGLGCLGYAARHKSKAAA
jgi:hypothetical protein